MNAIYTALPGLILAITALIWQYIHQKGHKNDGSQSG